MPDEFRSEFERLVRGADSALFADPASVRRIGSRRRTRNRAVATIAGGVTVLATAGVLTAAVKTPPGDGAGIGTAGTPSATASASAAHRSPAASHPAPTSAPVTSRPPATTAGPSTCAAADLDPRPYYGGGAAMGSSYTYVVVQNIGDDSCWLRHVPRLVGIDGGDSTETTMSVTPSGTVADYLVRPGTYAQFQIRTVNGNPYSPGAPECADPVDYHNLSVMLSSTGRFPLRDLRIAKECGPISSSGWQHSDYPDTGWENIRRAPA